jgi:hypothetical protein
MSDREREREREKEKTLLGGDGERSRRFSSNRPGVSIIVSAAINEEVVAG